MSAIFAFILEHALTWLKKLIILVLLDELFLVFSNWLHLTDLKYFWWYLGSILLFRLVPEDTFVFANFALSLIVGIAALVWVFGVHHLPGNHSKH